METFKDAGWLDDSRLNLGLVRDAQEKDVVVDLFLQYKKKGHKPEWNDISAQGGEFNSYWAQWEKLVIDGEELLCRELVGSGKSSRMQVALPLSLVDGELEMTVLPQDI